MKQQEPEDSDSEINNSCTLPRHEQSLSRRRLRHEAKDFPRNQPNVGDPEHDFETPIPSQSRYSTTPTRTSMKQPEPEDSDSEINNSCTLTRDEQALSRRSLRHEPKEFPLHEGNHPNVGDPAEPDFERTKTIDDAKLELSGNGCTQRIKPVIAGSSSWEEPFLDQDESQEEDDYFSRASDSDMDNESSTLLYSTCSTLPDVAVADTCYSVVSDSLPNQSSFQDDECGNGEKKFVGLTRDTTLEGCGCDPCESASNSNVITEKFQATGAETQSSSQQRQIDVLEAQLQEAELSDKFGKASVSESQAQNVVDEETISDHKVVVGSLHPHVHVADTCFSVLSDPQSSLHDDECGNGEKQFMGLSSVKSLNGCECDPCESDVLWLAAIQDTELSHENKKEAEELLSKAALPKSGSILCADDMEAERAKMILAKARGTPIKSAIVESSAGKEPVLDYDDEVESDSDDEYIGMVKTPRRSKAFRLLSKDFMKSLEINVKECIEEEDVKKCLSPERFNFVLQNNPESKPYHLSDSKGVAYLFWPSNGPSEKLIVEKENSDRLKIISGPIRNQEGHKLCGSYVVCDTISSTRVLHGLDKQFMPLSPLYLFRNVNQEVYEARKREAAKKKSKHCCFGYSMLSGLMYAQIHGVRRENPEEKIFDCLKSEKLGDDEELIKIKDVFYYENLDLALERLNDGYPIAAGLVCFEGWDDHWNLVDDDNMLIYSGPAYGAKYLGSHGVIIIDFRIIRGKKVAICKSSNGNTVANHGYLAVDLNILLLPVAADKGELKWCVEKPHYLLHEFYSIDMEFGSEPLIKLDPKRVKENMKYKVQGDDIDVDQFLAPKYQYPAMLPAPLTSDFVSGNLNLIRLHDYSVNDIPGRTEEKYLLPVASALDPEIQSELKVTKTKQDFFAQSASQRGRNAARMAMTRRMHPVLSLNPYQGSWTIKVGVANKGLMRTCNNSRGEGCLFNVELTDEQGTQIQATMSNAAARKFYDRCQMGKVYYTSRGSVKQANKQLTLNENSEAIDDDFLPSHELVAYVNHEQLSGKS